MLEALDEIHKELSGIISKNRKDAIDRHNAKTCVITYKPTLADYVLVQIIAVPESKYHQIGLDRVELYELSQTLLLIVSIYSTNLRLFR